MPGWDPSRGPPDGTIGSDRLISLTRIDEGRRYFCLDGLRSVVNLTDDSGSAAASYHLDTWGNFRFPTELNSSKNRFAFTGHIWDPETGLYNAKARYFDPKLGRFLTQDSFLGQIDNPPSLHRYFYANANPLRYVDTTGHEAAILTAASIDPKMRQQLEEQGKQAAAAAGWALGSLARQGWEAVKAGVDFMMLATDEGTQNALGQKIIEKTPLAAQAVAGDYLAQAELLGPVIESRRQAYEKGIDEYAAAKTPFERGWSATGTVLPEASIVAGGIAGLVRRGATAAVVLERNATVDAVETGAAAQAAKVATSGAEPVVGKVTYYHQLKPGKATDLLDVGAQAGRQVEKMNQIIAEEGIQGLKKRIEAYRADPSIEAAGRAEVRAMGPAGCTECGDPLAWLHEPDMATGGAPKDIGGKGLARSNSILGGQANVIADTILAMPNNVTKIDWQLVVREAGVRAKAK